MTRKPITLEEEGVLVAIARIATETRAPLAQLALKKLFGLAQHDIRLRLSEGEKPLYVRKELWKSDSMLEESYWRLPLQPIPIQIYCTSDTEPVVTSVTIFAKIPEGLADLVFLNSPSPKMYGWSRDFWNDKGIQISQAPTLKKGSILNVTFSENVRIGPSPDLTRHLLDRANREKEAVLGYLLAKRMAQGAESDCGSVLNTHLEASSSKIGEELDALAETLLKAHHSVTVSVVVTLVDSTLMPFMWNHEKREFSKGFFTGGVTVK